MKNKFISQQFYTNSTGHGDAREAVGAPKDAGDAVEASNDAGDAPNDAGDPVE